MADRGVVTAELCRDGRPLGPVVIARSLGARFRGLLGRDGLDGAMLIPGGNSIHTFGMRFAIDVAFLDRHKTVVRVLTMRPWRLTRPHLRARYALEAEAGTFAGWDLQPGHVLEVVE